MTDLATRRVWSGDVTGVLAGLESVYRRSSGAVVLISGAPGSGKSTTMDSLLTQILITTDDATRITRISADETSRRQPFGVISALVGMIPEYPPPADSADRVLAAVETLCAQGPAVLCADDVHHADADSLRVMRQLVDATNDLPLTLLLTRRWFPSRESLDLLASDPAVLAVEVVGVDSAGLAAMVRQRFGTGPGPGLTHALQLAGGNPFHIQTLLADLKTGDQIHLVDGLAEITSSVAVPAVSRLPSMQDSVRVQLRHLAADANDVLAILAVWGRPAPLSVLSSIAGLTDDDVRNILASALETEVVRWTDPSVLTFTHDVFRDVLYSDLLPGLKRMLHAACASELRAGGGIATEIVQHVGDSLVEGIAVDQALLTADTDLRYAPEQAADLLAQVHTNPGTREADAVAIARAGALAAAGRMADVVDVARGALAVTSDLRARNTLTRLQLHSMVSSAQVPESLAVIDSETARSNDPDYRETLGHLRRWVQVLNGDVHLTNGQSTKFGSSGAALVPSAMEHFLQARCTTALDMAFEAQRVRESAGSPTWADGATAPVWPGLFALYAKGPSVAAELSIEARRAAQSQGRGWLFPQHLGVAGEIDLFAGRWDDAIAVYQTQRETAGSIGTGWGSRGLGGLTQIQIQRGALDDAADAIDRWFSVDRPTQFGLPLIEHARLLLLEARGDTAAAAGLAWQTWVPTIDGGRVLWAFLAGPDVARIALRSGDRTLLERVRADTAAVPVEEVPVLAVVPGLVGAIAASDHVAARTAAMELDSAGFAVARLSAWEEAAVAAAADNDRDSARECATQCLALAASLGAQTVTRRLAARLREQGVRLGASGARGRPATGLDSLTPTELVVAERVAQGLTSPQIAAELFVSPRTVQGHVSSILRKLGLRSRVELAAMFARRLSEAG